MSVPRLAFGVSRLAFQPAANWPLEGGAPSRPRSHNPRFRDPFFGGEGAPPFRHER
jgi:hypothetical protein